MKNYYYTYKLEDPDTGMAYIGSRTKQGIASIVDDDAYRGTVVSKKWKDQWPTISARCKKSIIAVFDTTKEALEDEIAWHDLYNVGVNPRFYNEAKATCEGFSMAGVKKTAEHRAKLGLANKRRVWTEESRAKVSAAHKGKTISKEQKEKQSKALTGVKLSPERVAHMTGANNPNARLATIYDYATNEPIQTDTTLWRWAKEKGYCPSTLSATARADRSKPSTRNNRRQTQGIYAVYQETNK